MVHVRSVELEHKLCEHTVTVCEHYEEVEIIEVHAHHVLEMSRFGVVAVILAVLLIIYEFVID